MGTVSLEKVSIDESISMLQRARTLLRSGNDETGFDESISFSLGALSFLAGQLAKESNSFYKAPGREYAPRNWTVLDSFFVETLLPNFPEQLSKARRLLDLAAIHSRRPYELTGEIASEEDAAIVLQSATGVVRIVEELTKKGLSSGQVGN